MAEALRQPTLQWSVGWSWALLQLWRGSLADAEKLAQEAAQVGIGAGQPEALLFLGAQLVEIRRLQGRLDEVAPMLPSTPAGEADGFSTARYLLAAGRADAVRAAVPDCRHLRLRRDVLERPSLDNLAYCAGGLGSTDLGAAVAAAQHRRCELPLMEAESAVALRQALGALGDDSGAVKLDALARHLAATHGAPGVLTPLVSWQPE